MNSTSQDGTAPTGSYVTRANFAFKGSAVE